MEKLKIKSGVYVDPTGAFIVVEFGSSNITCEPLIAVDGVNNEGNVVRAVVDLDSEHVISLAIVLSKSKYLGEL